MATRPATDAQDWVFGYGSLVWRPAFEHEERIPAWIGGWTRRFWQGSTDHRGVPGAPGRVVTVLPDPAGRVHGMAYRLPANPHARTQILAELDMREKGGYERLVVEVHPFGAHAARPPFAALMYVATERNPNYLGPAPLDEIASRVRASRGPSGPNPEYVLALAEALRAMGADDPHVFALEELLRS